MSKSYRNKPNRDKCNRTRKEKSDNFKELTPEAYHDMFRSFATQWKAEYPYNGPSVMSSLNAKNF